MDQCGAKHSVRTKIVLRTVFVKSTVLVNSTVLVKEGISLCERAHTIQAFPGVLIQCINADGTGQNHLQSRV